MLEFDTDGNLLRSWGGPGEGYEWVGREHGIEVDERGFVWIGGNADNDNAILKFTLDGKFVAQIGKIAAAPRQQRHHASSASPRRPRSTRKRTKSMSPTATATAASSCSTPRRGAYKRHWGAYGNAPNDDKQPPYDPKAPVSQQFGNPVHCVKIANDGLVYVCDRINNRIQVFRKDGSFVKEWFYEKNTLGNGAVWDLAIWPDAKQTWLLNADGDQQRNPDPQPRGWHRGRHFRP